MINTLNDFKLLGSEELKNSIAEFLFKLYCKLPEQLKGTERSVYKTLCPKIG